MTLAELRGLETMLLRFTIEHGTNGTDVAMPRITKRIRYLTGKLKRGGADNEALDRR